MYIPTLTIHTATYNRADLLKRVYASLIQQTSSDFEWLITDDGSNDNTEELVKLWLSAENSFTIRYVKLNHGGLIRAVNYAISESKGKYYFRLDSDDYLKPNAVQTIIEKTKEIDCFEKYVGVGFVRVKVDGTPIKGIWPKVNSEGFVDCTNLERKDYDLDADMCEAYKIQVMRNHPFPVWENEMFAPEQLQSDQLALEGYLVRWYSLGIYVCEYQAGGLTQGNWDLLRNNKMGYAMLSNQRLLYSTSIIERFKAAGQHIALSIVAGYPKYILKSNNKWMTLLALPYGIVLSFRRRKQFKWDDPVNRRNFK